MRDNRTSGGLQPTRRQWLLGSAGLAGASLWSRTARADHYGPADGTRVLVIGDSMIAGGFGLYLARGLGKDHGHSVTRRGKSSSGLARPDFFDWIEEANTLVGENPFDATVVMFGGNDVQGLYMGKGAWVRWDDEGWSEEYARRINALADLVAPNGQQLFWIGMPVMRPSKFNRRVQRVNTIFRAEMAIRPQARFVDIWDLFANAKGEYADRIVLPPPPEETEAAEAEAEADSQEEADPPPKRKRKKVRVRAGDGIHLTVAGAHYLADHVEAIV
ncbi:MAG: DUF459 domain-containing protein, partial [Deltaproteobacteria bacterium]|nr:DUF459 domain-containing protein [Deltaproteobacteria bacterium]